jgi:hypothetical protein
MPLTKGIFWSRIIDALPLNEKSDKVLTCDLLVQCGAPVYWKGANSSEWFSPLIRKRYQHIKEKVHFINIGAGACYSYHCKGPEIVSETLISDFIKEFHSMSTVTTVRDSLSKSILNLLNLDAPVIPCPSIFAGDRLSISPRAPEYVALNYMALGGHWSFGQKIDTGNWKKTFVDLYKAISEKTPVLIVCHDAFEHQQARSMLPEAPLFFGSTASEYLDFYSKAQCFIGNRVHGAYAVASFGRPAIVIGNDTRAHMMELVGMSSIFVNNASVELLLSCYKNMIKDFDSYFDKIQIIKKNAFESYMEVLSSIDVASPNRSAN